MQINSISKFNYQILNRQNFNQKEVPVEQSTKETLEKTRFGYSDLVFNGRVNLVKPKFDLPIQEKIANKITNYLKILPESSKMKTPIVMKFDDRVVEMLMDKTSVFGTTDVSLKMFYEKLNYTTQLNMTIDKYGQVKSGLYTEPGALDTAFERVSRNPRKIIYGGATYRPLGDDDTLWIRMLTHKDETIAHEAPARKEFNDTELQGLLSEMAKKNTSFLIK